MALPAYLEDTAKDFAKQSTATYSTPIETSTFTGGVDAAGNRASGAAITGANPFVAAMDPLQTQAQQIAQQGIGSYSPYLTAATTNIANQAGLTGPGAYSSFMSPFQQQVIDTSLADFDASRVGNRQAIQDQAVVSGNFGGGREGAMLGQYDADTTQGRAALLAGLQQQGFTQANTLAQQAFANQQQLAQNQMGLSNFARGSMGQDISALGSLGALNQQQAQANLRANQLAQQTAAYEPYGRLQQYGQGLTGLAGGVASAYQDPAPVQSPLSQAIATATGLGGLYARLYGPQPTFGVLGGK
tara:strand:+ start:688 stop:1590 length:903 start_codon:yes stop_codon:yes gene_type:complete